LKTSNIINRSILRFAKRVILFLYLLLAPYSELLASGPPKLFHTGAKLSKTPVARTRFTFAPVISFYKPNKNHAGGASQKMAFLFSLKEEIRMNDKHNCFFLFGIEYMPHGLNFSSYYFKADSVQLYGENFNATYSLYVHELDFPLQMKLTKRENNKEWTPYLMVGYIFREILNANLKAYQNGEEVQKRNVDVTFKNSVISPKQGSFLSASLGLQKNNPNNTRHAFYAEVSYRIALSPFMIKDSFAPSNLYINNSFLYFGFGAKF
jgi:hypothetical protein